MPATDKAPAGNPGQLMKELERLCDPSLHSLEEAVALASGMMRENRLLDAKLVRWVLYTSQANMVPHRGPHVIRALDVLAAIAEHARIMPYLVQLLRSPDPNVRSKAVLVIGRGSRNATWAEHRITEPDPRVRANAVEALWGVPSDRSRTLLWSMVEDSNNRVVGNAIVGLYRLGESGSIPLLLNMSAHSSARFRATAAWVMGELRDPRFVPVLAGMVRDANEMVRRNVFRALLGIKHRIKAVLEAGRLDVMINLVACLSDGSRRLRVTVAPSSGHELSERLAATRFIIRETGRFISGYSFEGDSRPDKLVIGVALPCGPAVSVFRRWVQQSLFDCLERKRHSDVWSVVRYPEPLEESTSGDACAEATPGSNSARRSSDPEVLRRELAVQRSTIAADAGTEGALKMLLRDLAELAGIRHVILLADARDRSRPDPDVKVTDIVEMAAASGIAVHAIVPEGSPSASWLQEVSRQTRGSSYVVSTENETTFACARIYAGLLNSYDILYRPEAAPAVSGQTEVAVEVYCDEGHGQADRPLILEASSIGIPLP